jgi:hypothetical protein
MTELLDISHLLLVGYRCITANTVSPIWVKLVIDELGKLSLKFASVYYDPNDVNSILHI